MIYWIVFSTYTVIEEITDVLTYWLPLYYEIKVCLLELYWSYAFHCPCVSVEITEVLLFLL